MKKVPLGPIWLNYHKRSFYIEIPKNRWPFSGIEKGRDFILKLLSRNKILFEPLSPKGLEVATNAVIKQGKIANVRRVGILGRDLTLNIPMLMIEKLKMKDKDLFELWWLGGQRFLLRKYISKNHH